MGPDVSPFEQIDHAFWLLSIASSWLPKSTHAVLLKGMKELKSWLWQDLGIENPMRRWKTNGALAKALCEASLGERKFRWTNEIRDDIFNRIEVSISELDLPESSEELFDKFMQMGFVSNYLNAERKRRLHQKRGKRVLGSD